jgi:hypothetical protein
VSAGNCPSCGAMIEPFDRSCIACGVPVNVIPLPPVTSVPSVTTVPAISAESNKETLVTGGASYARDRAPEPGKQAPDPLAGLRNGAWLDAQEFAPLSWAIPGLVPEGFTLLVGPPKAGKSWVLLGCLLAMAAGGHALGHIQCDPRRVLNMAFEDGDRRQQSRCRSLMGRDPIPPRYDYMTRLVNPTAPNVLGWTMKAYLERFDDAGMIAIDTLGKVMPDAKNGQTTYSRDYQIGSQLKSAADSRRGLSVIAVHHDRKAATEDFVESVSGTNGLAGAADTIIVLNRKRQSAEALLMVTGRDVMEGEYALKLKQGVWELDGRNLAEASKQAKTRRETEDLGEVSRKILDYFGEHPEGCRSAEITAKFGPGARVYLSRLEEAGRLDKVERGLYVLPADNAWEDAS